MSVIIGLTGSIATGKSTIAKMFKELEIEVIDADLIAREVVEAGEPAYIDIVQAFGESILEDNKEINRKALGNIVFNDDAKRKTLNNIIHPAIRKEMLAQRDALIKSGSEVIVMDIPLIFESGLEDYVEKILFSYTTETSQLKRLIAREKYTEKEDKRQIKKQMSIAETKEKEEEKII